MWLNSCLLWWLLLKATQATPQDSELEAEAGIDVQIVTEPPYPATETTNIALFASPTCEASCTVYVPQISILSWVPEEKIIHTADVTVGIITTLVLLCNDVMVATRMQTEYHWDAAPAGMYPPYLTTNARGNAVAIAAFTDAAITSVVELVYPNSHIAYDTQLSWEGIIPLSLPRDRGDSPAVCVTATSELSTTSLHTYVPFPRGSYPEPTVARSNGSYLSGRGFRPLWVPLDSQPPDSFFYHFVNSDQTLLRAGLFWDCQITALVSPTPSIFFEPNYAFDHKTLSIDLDASGMGSKNTSPGRWRNSTGSGTLCVDYTEQFAGLCEKPEVHASPSECVITIWEEAAPTNTTLWLMNSEGDRTGRFTPRPKTGFETAYDLSDTVTPFLFATKDWVLDTNGGVVTTPAPQAVQSDRPPNSAEAPFIESYLNNLPSLVPPLVFEVHAERTAGGWLDDFTRNYLSLFGNHPQDRVGSPRVPQRTPPPTKPGQSIDFKDAMTLTNHLNEHPEYLFQPAIDAQRIGVKTITPTAVNGDSPTIVEPQAVKAAANNLPGTIATTLREFLYVQVSTTINSRPTTVAGYVIPTSSTVMANQDVTINGKAMKIALPDLLPTYLSTMINGVPTSILGYIVRGQSSGTVGQAVTLNGRTTVLPVPDAVFTQLSATIDGTPTTTLAYIIGGSSTASVGQRVTLNGTPTVLAAPDLVPTYITTMINGIAESGLAYVVTGETTATVGQTVTLDGRTTVLDEPTGNVGGEPRVVEGAACGSWRVSSNAVLLGVGAVLVTWL